MAVTCYIGIGSNLNSPLRNAQIAIDAIKQLNHCHFIASSALYGSKPMGPQDQPDYINAVVAIDTTLAPLALLAQLQQIEQSQGRERKAERWGPRTLDLDILLYGNEIIDLPELTIPHYDMKQREFVLYPLAEIAPKLQLPCGASIETLLQQCPLNGLEKVAH